MNTVKVHKKVAALEKEVCNERFPEVMIDGQCCMATDGCMAVVLGHYQPIEPPLQTTYLLDKATVQSVKDEACKSSKHPDFGYALVGFEAQGGTSRQLAKNTITALVDKATSKCKGEPKEFCFDLDRLVQLAKVLYAGESSGKKVVTVKVYDDDTAPIVVEAKLAKAEAVAYLAPCRK